MKLFEKVDKNSSFSPYLKPSFILQSLTENSPTSAGIESEYDTASTNSRSDNEQDEYEDDEEDSLDDEATGKYDVSQKLQCITIYPHPHF